MMLRTSVAVGALVAFLSSTALAQEGSYSFESELTVGDACEGVCDATDDACMDQCEDKHKACILECTRTGYSELPCTETCVYGRVISEEASAQGMLIPDYSGSPSTYSGSGHSSSSETSSRSATSATNRELAIGANLRGYIHNVPNFILGSFLEEYQSHWNGSPKYIFGGELVFRRNEKTDIIVGVDWADYRTVDGWWLQNNEPIASADWVENSMRTVTLSIEWNAIAHLDQKKRAQLYGGFGIGAGFRLGEFTKWDVPEGCFARGTDIGLISSYSPTDMCPNLSGVDMVQNGSPDGETDSRHFEKIPRVLPSLILTAGFRYMIADVVSIGIEGGFKTAGFYGGLELGFVAGKR